MKNEKTVVYSVFVERIKKSMKFIVNHRSHVLYSFQFDLISTHECQVVWLLYIHIIQFNCYYALYILKRCSIFTVFTVFTVFPMATFYISSIRLYYQRLIKSQKCIRQLSNADIPFSFCFSFLFSKRFLSIDSSASGKAIDSLSICMRDLFNCRRFCFFLLLLSLECNDKWQSISFQMLSQLTLSFSLYVMRN